MTKMRKFVMHIYSCQLASKWLAQQEADFQQLLCARSQLGAVGVYIQKGERLPNPLTHKGT